MLRSLNPKHSSVLIVEDNPDDALILKKALETFGIRAIFYAETAEDALAFLGKRPCDAALVDYNLPGINGLRLLERLRESWSETRVILVTGVRDERIAVSAMKLGAADYVAKDELLTSGVIRSLQAVLRERDASHEERRREVLSGGQDKLEVASTEAEWLLESFSWSPEEQSYRPALHAAPGYGDEGWEDVLDAFSRYLRECFHEFPAPATREEEALVRMLTERGLSPRMAVMVYRAALRSFVAEGTEAPFSPTVFLVRLLARLVEEYEERLAIEALKRQTA